MLSMFFFPYYKKILDKYFYEKIGSYYYTLKINLYIRVLMRSSRTFCFLCFLNNTTTLLFYYFK